MHYAKKPQQFSGKQNLMVTHPGVDTPRFSSLHLQVWVIDFESHLEKFEGNSPCVGFYYKHHPLMTKVTQIRCNRETFGGSKLETNFFF